MTREHFESIYRSHFEALYRAAYLRLRQADDALDVVQDAMLHLWQKAECPDNPGPICDEPCSTGSPTSSGLRTRTSECE